MIEIESVTVIPMNKESIFGEPYSEFEMFNCSSSYKEWEEKVGSRLELNNNTETAQYFGLTRIPETEMIANEFRGYMFGPVAKYGTLVLMAETKQFDSLRDLLNDDYSNCFLYAIGKISFGRDEKDFSEKTKYVLRYAENVAV